jgi:hypothetical protein
MRIDGARLLFRFGYQGCARRPDAIQPLLFVPDPSRHFVASATRPVVRILCCIIRAGLFEPTRHLRG